VEDDQRHTGDGERGDRCGEPHTPTRRARLKARILARLVGSQNARFLRRVKWENWLVNRIEHAALAEAAADAKGRLMDVGCGWKPHGSVFRDRVTEHIGLEHPALPSQTPVVDVYGDALALPFASGSAGTVLSTNVLEHVTDPLQALEEAARVLQPGCHLILTVPHMWPLHDEPHDYFRYTPHGLRHLCTAAGLEVVRLEALGGFWITVTTFASYYLSLVARKLRGGAVLAIPAIVGLQGVGLLCERIHSAKRYAWLHLLVARMPGEEDQRGEHECDGS